ncbi:MAG: hypothetical protein AB7H66_08405 [Hyphomonadaceae bacterium]
MSTRQRRKVEGGIIAALAGVLLAACASPGAPRPALGDDDVRLAYQITVTAPGTRSQGWRGTLYEADGSPIALAPGARVETPAGRFVGVACAHPWSACGSIEEGMVRWMQTHQHNIPMRERWTYRIYARGFYGDRLEGELVRDGAPVEAIEQAATPMGAYRWIDAAEGTATASRRGWWHESWE